MIVTPTRQLLALVLTCLVGVTMPFGTTAAQDPSIGPREDAPTVEGVTALRESAKADSSLDESQQAKVLQLYDRALRSLQAADRLRADTARVREQAKSAPARIAKARQQTETFEDEPQARGVSPEHIAQLSDEALAARVEQARRALDTAIDEFLALRQVLREQGVAPLESSGQTEDVLDVAGDGASGVFSGRASEGPEASIALARRTLAHARTAERRARRDLSRIRVDNHDLLATLNFARVRIVRREMQRAVRELDTLADALARRGIAAARVQIALARSTLASVAGLPAPLVQRARTNLALHEETERLLVTVADAARRRRAERMRAALLEGQLTADHARLAAVGPTAEIGKLILERVDDAPSTVELDQAAAARQAARVAAVDRSLQIERRYRRIAFPEREVATVLAGIPEAERAEFGETWLAAKALELIEVELESLAALHTLNGRYLWVLARTDDSARWVRAVVDTVTDVARIDLLWVRNLRPIALRDLGELDDALPLLASAPRWRGTLRSIVASFRAVPGTSFTLLVLLSALVLYRGRALRELDWCSKQIRHARTDGFRHTVRALVNTVLLAARWPLALVWVGWLALSKPGNESFSMAFGQATSAAGLALVAFAMVYRAAQPEGLPRHFRWPQATCLAVRSDLRWFAPLFLVASGLVMFTDQLRFDPATLAVGRPAMIVLCVALSVLVWRLFGSGRALRSHIDSLDAPTPLARWRSVWYPLLLAIPLLFAAGSALGYHHAAVKLAPALLRTLWLGLGLFLVREILLRWFYVSQRRLKLQARLQRMEESREALHADGVPAQGEAEGIEVTEEEVDFEALYEQARSVIQAGLLIGAALGLWALWGDLVPALGLAERIELPFNRIALVGGIERAVPVTLSDLLVAVGVFAGAFYAARNLAGLLSFTILRRLDAGASYAVVTLCQYVLIAFGIVYASSAIGLQWSKLQWLVAALGVGLGFGLQEIVANFVSGIILLLERPVRVGDIVTVGDADGKVARIQIRATTIITWERKELVIPNKEFITGRVLNWTLSDTHLRMFTPIGIAYGSDVRRARELILEAATENVNVLADPAPSVHFGAFGNDALELELRYFVPSIEVRLHTKTAVHEAIYDKLAEAGITIAFPQRDVHLDLSGPLDVRVDGAEAAQGRPRGDERPSWRRAKR